MSRGTPDLHEVATACAAADEPASLAAAIQVGVRACGGLTAHVYRTSAAALYVERVPRRATQSATPPQVFVGEHPVLSLLPPSAGVVLATESEAGDALLAGEIGQALLVPFGADDELLLRLGAEGSSTWLGIALPMVTDSPGLLERGRILRTLLAGAHGWVRSKQLDRAFAATAGGLLERRGRLVLVADSQGRLHGIDGHRPDPGEQSGVPGQLIHALELMLARDANGGLERGTEISMADAGGRTISAKVLPKVNGDSVRSVVIDLPRRPTSAEDLGRLGLSGRQAEVLALILSGETTSAVGNRLGISSKTAQKHLEQAYRRLGAHSRLEALAQVLEAV